MNWWQNISYIFHVDCNVEVPFGIELDYKEFIHLPRDELATGPFLDISFDTQFYTGFEVHLYDHSTPASYIRVGILGLSMWLGFLRKGKNEI